MARVLYPFGPLPFPVPRDTGPKGFAVDADPAAPSAGYLSGFPFGYDLDAIMRLHWRVRRWKVRLEAFASIGGSGTANIVLEQSFGFNQNGSLDESEQADESQLVLPLIYRPMKSVGGLSATNTSDTTGLINGNGGEASLGFQMFGRGADTAGTGFDGSLYASGLFVDSGSQLLYPQLLLQSTVITGDFPGYDNLAPGYFQFYLGLSGGTFPATINFEAQPPQIVANAVLATFNPVPADTCTTTVTITAEEYWEYRNAAGVPLYDATTGN